MKTRAKRLFISVCTRICISVYKCVCKYMCDRCIDVCDTLTCVIHGDQVQARTKRLFEFFDTDNKCVCKCMRDRRIDVCDILTYGIHGDQVEARAKRLFESLDTDANGILDQTELQVLLFECHMTHSHAKYVPGLVPKSSLDATGKCG